MKIALIDDELILTQTPRFFSVQRFEMDNERVKTVLKRAEGKITHATECYEILNQEIVHAERHQLIHINIAKGGQITINNFLLSLKFLSEQYVDILCLSIGTTTLMHVNKIYDAIKRLSAKGTLIIAANSNTNLCTYPTFFPEAMGVIDLPETYFEYGILYRIPPNDLNVNLGMVQKYHRGNSFVAPLVSAYFINKMENYTKQPLAKCLYTFFEECSREIDENKKSVMKKVLKPKMKEPIPIMVVLGEKEQFGFLKKVMDVLAEKYQYESSCIVDFLDGNHRGFRFIRFNEWKFEQQIIDRFHRDIDLLFIFLQKKDTEILSKIIKDNKYKMVKIRKRENVQIFCRRILQYLE